MDTNDRLIKTDSLSNPASAILERRMSGWQPIETAPLDGSFILLCGGAVENDEGFDRQARPAVAAWLPDRKSGKFMAWEVAYSDGTTVEYAGPTHWMPIPALPG